MAERGNAAIEAIANREYEAGFVTEIEQDTLPPGLDEDVIRTISAKKNEPRWLLDWRLKAFRRWLEMREEDARWAKVDFDPIDYQAISYYSAPKRKPKLESLDQRCLVDTGACVGFGIVEIASDHAQALVLQSHRLVEIGDDENVAMMELLQPLDERAGQRVVPRDDDVVGDTRLQLTRDARRVLGFDPGSPEELQEGEGQQDEHENRAGQQHHS